MFGAIKAPYSGLWRLQSKAEAGLEVVFGAMGGGKDEIAAAEGEDGFEIAVKTFLKDLLANFDGVLQADAAAVLRGTVARFW